MSGFYLMHRGWQDHPVFGNEPYSKRDAFEWLIANACHKPTAVAGIGATIQLQRGQLSYSLRYIARAWRWDEAKVRRFLSRLSKEQMIVTETDAGMTRITVCNYETYQLPEKQTDAAATQQRRSSDASPTQIRMNENESNNISSDAEEFYAAYPRKVAKPKALRAYAAARKKADHATIMAGLERYKRTKPAYADWAHPASWLNAERWADEAPQPALAPASQAPPRQLSMAEKIALAEMRKRAAS